MKKILPKVLLHLTEIDVKMCFDVKTVSLKEKQQKYFAVNMNERQSTTLGTDRFEMDEET